MKVVDPAPNGALLAASAQRLGVPINASHSLLRAAFRAQALRWHPDRNLDPSARERFREARDAYRALSEAQRDPADIPHWTSAPALACNACNSTERPLNVVTIRRLRSYLLFSRASLSHDVYCRPCARTALLRASAASGLTGFWSLTGAPLVAFVAMKNGIALDGSAHLNVRLALNHPVAEPADGKYRSSRRVFFRTANICAALLVPAVVATSLFCWLR